MRHRVVSEKEWRGNGEPDDREHFTMIIHLDFIL